MQKFTHFSVPTNATKLGAYVYSNKWVMNPGKPAQFTNNELIPSVANKYLYHILYNKMPHGLKNYMEYELFPQIDLKIKQDISISTAGHWLHLEGFQ